MKGTYLFNLCSSILFIIATQLTVFTLITFLSHLYSARCKYCGAVFTVRTVLLHELNFTQH